MNPNGEAEHLKIQVKRRSRGLGNEHGRCGFSRKIGFRLTVRRPAGGCGSMMRLLAPAQYTPRQWPMLRPRRTAHAIRSVVGLPADGCPHPAASGPREARFRGSNLARLDIPERALLRR